MVGDAVFSDSCWFEVLGSFASRHRLVHSALRAGLASFDVVLARKQGGRFLNLGGLPAISSHKRLCDQYLAPTQDIGPFEPRNTMSYECR